MAEGIAADVGVLTETDARSVSHSLGADAAPRGPEAVVRDAFALVDRPTLRGMQSELAVARDAGAITRQPFGRLDASIESCSGVDRVSQSLSAPQLAGARGADALARVIRGEPHCTKAMAKGVVDFFNDTGGYGFIETDDADEDVFFHMEDVGGPDLEEGQEVEFDIEEAEKGPRAKNLTRL